VRSRRDNTLVKISFIGLLLLGLAWTRTITAQLRMVMSAPGLPSEVSTWAENRSYRTLCAEEDNVNVPLFSLPEQVVRFQVIATHPTYKVGVDKLCP